MLKFKSLLKYIVFLLILAGTFVGLIFSAINFHNSKKEHDYSLESNGGTEITLELINNNPLNKISADDVASDLSSRIENIYDFSAEVNHNNSNIFKVKIPVTEAHLNQKFKEEKDINIWIRLFQIGIINKPVINFHLKSGKPIFNSNYEFKKDGFDGEEVQGFNFIKRNSVRLGYENNVPVVKFELISPTVRNLLINSFKEFGDLTSDRKNELRLWSNYSLLKNYLKEARGTVKPDLIEELYKKDSDGKNTDKYSDWARFFYLHTFTETPKVNQMDGTLTIKGLNMEDSRILMLTLNRSSQMYELKILETTLVKPIYNISSHFAISILAIALSILAIILYISLFGIFGLIASIGHILTSTILLVLLTSINFPFSIILTLMIALIMSLSFFINYIFARNLKRKFVLDKRNKRNFDFQRTSLKTFGIFLVTHLPFLLLGFALFSLSQNFIVHITLILTLSFLFSGIGLLINYIISLFTFLFGIFKNNKKLFLGFLKARELGNIKKIDKTRVRLNFFGKIFWLIIPVFLIISVILIPTLHLLSINKIPLYNSNLENTQRVSISFKIERNINEKIWNTDIPAEHREKIKEKVSNTRSDQKIAKETFTKTVENYCLDLPKRSCEFKTMSTMIFYLQKKLSQNQLNVLETQLNDKTNWPNNTNNFIYTIKNTSIIKTSYNSDMFKFLLIILAIVFAIIFLIYGFIFKWSFSLSSFISFLGIIAIPSFIAIFSGITINIVFLTLLLILSSVFLFIDSYHNRKIREELKRFDSNSVIEHSTFSILVLKSTKKSLILSIIPVLILSIGIITIFSIYSFSTLWPLIILSIFSFLFIYLFIIFIKTPFLIKFEQIRRRIIRNNLDKAIKKSKETKNISEQYVKGVNY